MRLASQLTGWDIDILTEQEESERRQKEFAERTQLFMDSLDVDEVIAQLLVTEGFATIEEVAYVDLSEIAHIEGFDEAHGRADPERARANTSSSRKPSAMPSGASLALPTSLRRSPASPPR